MKIKAKIFGISIVFTLCNYLLCAGESCDKTTPIGWIDCREVHISGDSFYIDTNLGAVKLTVLDYDEEKERYLVECIKYGDFFYPTPEES